MTSSKTIGIIGGGQLGQMMAISAIYMGHKVITLDPAADCPASKVSEVIVAPYHDVAALKQLAERCDVLTYEFENVDADGLDAVIKDGQLPQGTDLLRISQNRIFEKDFLAKKAGVQVAPYKVVTSSLDLEGLDLSKNYVLKTATGGYDGHGQKVIREEADLVEASQLANSAECVLEEFVNFDLEISVLVSGNGSDYTVFPVQENIHRNNILYKTIVPARISDELAEKAKTMALQIADKLHLAGTLCVEMFVAGQDILVNEISPRPHNSGHYSIEACDFSQFDTHIKGILGEPLPPIRLLSPAVMINVLGQDMEAVQTFLQENPTAHPHFYGKLEAKHNRKMGHVTVLGEDVSLGSDYERRFVIIKNFKKILFWIFTIAYPLLAILIFTKEIIEFLSIYCAELNKDVVGAFVLSLLLIMPYAVLKRVSCFDKNSHKYYFISQSILLVLFTFASIAQIKGFDYAINVWGIIFVGISLIDTIADISMNRE